MEAYRFSPTDRTATTVAEFVKACQSVPEVAAEHLREGYFEAWLIDVGRRDLAKAAAQLRMSGIAAREALQQFVRAARESQSRPRARNAPTQTASG